MYSNIYQAKANKYNLDKSNYLLNSKQKNNNFNENYINKRPNSTKFLNSTQHIYQDNNYDLLNHIESNPKIPSNYRIKSSK